MSLKEKLRERKKRKREQKIIKNPSWVVKMKNPKEEDLLVAVNNHDYIIRYFPNAPKSIKLAHIDKWGGKALFSIDNPSDDIIIYAMKIAT